MPPTDTPMTPAELRARAQRLLARADALDGGGDQLARADLDGMAPAAIEQARRAGRLRDVLSGSDDAA